MAGKFHVTEKGVGVCRARKSRCPFDTGKEQTHFDSREEAQASFDKKMFDKEIPLAKTTAKKDTKKSPQPKKAAGSNVSLNEKYLVDSLVDGKFNEAAENIHQLPENQKAVPFRGLEKDKIKETILSLDSLLRKNTSVDETFSAPIGNQNAQDLYANTTKKNIELKIGYGITDAAVGFSTISKIAPENTINIFKNQENLQKRKELIKDGKSEEAFREFQKSINKARKEIEKHQTPSEEERRALNLFAAGVMRGDTLDEHLKDSEKEIDNYLLVKVKKPEVKGEAPGWEVADEKIYNPDRQWTYTTRDSEERFTIIANGDDGARIIMTLNQKNSKVITNDDGEKIKTRYKDGAIGQLSFNVWVRQPDSPKEIR